MRRDLNLLLIPLIPVLASFCCRRGDSIRVRSELTGGFKSSSLIASKLSFFMMKLPSCESVTNMSAVSKWASSSLRYKFKDYVWLGKGFGGLTSTICLLGLDSAIPDRRFDVWLTI